MSGTPYRQHIEEGDEYALDPPRHNDVERAAPILTAFEIEREGMAQRLSAITPKPASSCLAGLS